MQEVQKMYPSAVGQRSDTPVRQTRFGSIWLSFDNGMLVTGVSGAEPFDPAALDGLEWAGFEDWVVDRARESGDWEVRLRLLPR